MSRSDCASPWTTNPRAPLHPSHPSPTATNHHPCPAKTVCVPLVWITTATYLPAPTRTRPSPAADPSTDALTSPRLKPEASRAHFSEFEHSPLGGSG